MLQISTFIFSLLLLQVIVTTGYYYYYRFLLQVHNAATQQSVWWKLAKLLSASFNSSILYFCLETIWSSEVTNNDPACSLSATAA